MCLCRRSSFKTCDGKTLQGCSINYGIKEHSKSAYVFTLFLEPSSEFLPNGQRLRIGRRNFHDLVAHGVLKADVAGMQADGAVGIGAASTIFQIPFHGAADG